MTLYNKDGSVYKLSGPNPAMETQDVWDGFTVHNMSWDTETKEDNTVVIPKKSDFDLKDNFVTELEKTKPEIKIVVPKTDKVPLQKAPEPPEAEKFERKTVVHEDRKRKEEEQNPEIEKNFIHFLPATIKTKTDSLYGESHKTVQYGSPSSFEGVILVQEDFKLVVWTDVNKVTLGSILYPKTMFKRWWKVNKTEPKEGGFLIESIPSDYQPSFES
jgi:hypothetical protein